MFNEYLELYLEKVQEMDPIYLGATALVGLIILGIIISAINKAGKKTRAKKIAPVLTLKQIQIAPLGKGAQVKIENIGEVANIKEVSVMSRKDIRITQAYKNYILEKNKGYSIFCEVDGKGRADNGFNLLIAYFDSRGNAYKQTFFISKDSKAAEKPKLVKLV